MLNYYLTGPDGSGKTTLLERIEQYLITKGDVPGHIWLRSPKILSKPLMLFCRLTGLTKYETIDGVRYGRHEFYRSAFVSWLFPFLQLIDFRIMWLIKAKNYKTAKTLLFDRFALDTLADLMVDTSRYDLHLKKTGKSFIKLIPENTQIIVLKVNENQIRKRKLDTLHDPHIVQKIKVYEILRRDLGLVEIDNNRSLDLVIRDVFHKFNLGEEYKG